MSTKTVTLNVIKKNRVYFKCENESGYAVKLRVTPESENLELGLQTLVVNDETVRTKYGVDVIYSLQANVAETGIVTLKAPYNKNLVEACRNLGGRWDGASECWVFSKIVEDEVELLDEKYNSDIITVEISNPNNSVCDQPGVSFCGYPLARAYDRDSGAKLYDDVCLISGNVRSGGSRKNWSCVIVEGSVLRLRVARGAIAEDTGPFIWREIK